MEYKQVFIINEDLKMSKGKIPVQVGHGAIYYMNMILNIVKVKERAKNTLYIDNYGSQKIEIFDKWFGEGGGLMKKVVLKATEQEMEDLYKQLEEKKIWSYKIHDAGLTQVQAGSFTCLAVEPLPEDVADQLFGHLKLL